MLTRKRPQPEVSRRLLRPVHEAFGGNLKYLFCGGAFVNQKQAEFFYRLGIPVVIGYGLTEACTVATLNDLRPFRGDSVGLPVPGVELRICDPDEQGVGQVAIKGPTLMTGYYDEPEMTSETLVDGWLLTGDLGRIDASGHLHLVGRQKNMIVTPGGKNIYPEDIENNFSKLNCEEYAIFSSQYIWPTNPLSEEALLFVTRPKNGSEPSDVIARVAEINRKLPEHKRVRGVMIWETPFPRTASLKLKRQQLADELRTSDMFHKVQSLQSDR